ncbi:hypothetical protein FHE72_01080 [Rossellomorea vietnamensis]|uniref:Uncharacterized protein n=1 Tax=Rossellomorea vietnamensis TaxID=218284 RepID=A0A6I6UNK0_9BACI|nr:TnsD family Tn7-like transposition protein [Rossellomorea vietnamensis]QHE59786.1 hypothetical protein FHE72_01080 [Rossellomorea vietnamensis]
MLSFFPPCYEDELLYSVLARFHQRSGNSSFKSTLIDLFDTDTILAVTDFTSGLDTLCRKTNMLYNAKELIENHSLLPYYRPFLTKEINEKVSNLLCTYNSTGVHISMGIIQTNVSLPQYLKFCVSCYEEDETTFGEAYWHRSHQLPGVYLCPFHCEILNNSYIPFKKQEHNQHYYALSNIDLKSCEPCGPVDYIEKQRGIFKKISEYSLNLLESKVAPLGLRRLREVYVSYLAERGFITSSGRVRFKKFSASFKGFYGEEILGFLQCNFTEYQEDTWLHKVLRKPRISCNPLRHLLLLLYFNQDTKVYTNFGCEKNKYKPFQSVTYPCLNKAADHYMERVVKELKISRDSETGKPVGTFICNCGFIYSRKGPDNSLEDEFRIGRIKNFGHIWERKLLELSNKGLSRREISAELGVDYNTVKKYLHILENIEQEKLDDSAIKEFNSSSIQEKYRTEWLNHMKLNLNQTRTEIRKRKPSVYMWLYRHDKDWLYKNLPPAINKVGPNNRVNWQRRDLEIVKLIEREVDNILAIDPPERVTISKIGQRTQKSALLEKKMERLPKTKKVLEEVVESIEEFQIRRIRNIASKKREAREEVKEWEIIREAGLRPEYIGLMSETIQNEIKFDLY